MVKFRKIVAVDPCGLTGTYKDKILSLSEDTPVLYDSLPESRDEIVRRIGDADCVLVSWNTRIDAEVISRCPAVKYIGMCCSLYDEASANVDIAEARNHNIVVKGVRDYGDNGTVEFIFAQLISLYKGLGAHQWRSEPTELTGKTIGIVGMGVLGLMVARTALNFGMKAVYYSRTRKPEAESAGISYRDLHALLAESDVVTTHLPRNTRLLGRTEFRFLKPDAVYVNTSLGKPFDKQALLEWIAANTGNYAVFDAAGYSDMKDILLGYPNVILLDKSSGFTLEARQRLTQKVWQNMTGYLQDTRP